MNKLAHIGRGTEPSGQNFDRAYMGSHARNYNHNRKNMIGNQSRPGKLSAVVHHEGHPHDTACAPFNPAPGQRPVDRRSSVTGSFKRPIGPDGNLCQEYVSLVVLSARLCHANDALHSGSRSA